MSSCSKCGAPIKSLDDHNCVYCGALIKNKDGELIEENVFDSYQEFLQSFKEKIRKLELKEGEISLDFDDDVIWEDVNKKIAAEINNLYIPVEQQDISNLAQYLKSRISYSANASNQNLWESDGISPVPSAWVAKAEELSTSITFAEDNDDIMRFAEVLNQAIKEGKTEIEIMSKQKGKFNTYLYSGLFGFIVITILAIVVFS
mgnify:CR=1 FL=1